jgi:hypothetical protein
MLLALGGRRSLWLVIWTNLTPKPKLFCHQHWHHQLVSPKCGNINWGPSSKPTTHQPGGPGSKFLRSIAGWCEWVEMKWPRTLENATFLSGRSGRCVGHKQHIAWHKTCIAYTPTRRSLPAPPTLPPQNNHQKSTATHQDRRDKQCNQWWYLQKKHYDTMILRAGWWLNQHSQVVLLHEISQFNTLRIPIQGKPIMTNHPARYMHKNFYASILSYSQLLNWVVLPSRLQKTCQTTMSNHIKHCVWLMFNTFFQPILWKPKTNAIA